MSISTEPPPSAVEPSCPRNRGLIVICAANNYDAVKVADHHMAERMADRASILYVDPPLSHLSPRNKPELRPSLDGPRLRRVAAGFWRLTPVVAPFPLRPRILPATQRRVRRLLARAVRRIGLPVQAVISAWPLIDVFGVCDEQLDVWWAQDDFAAGAELMGQIGERIAAAERLRAEASDFVVAANPEVMARWQAEHHDVELIPYGSDPETFAGFEQQAPFDGVSLPAPVAVLVGQLNERVDPAFLAAVADRGVSLLLVGPAAQPPPAWLSSLTARGNVTWVGPQPFSALPGFLAHARVGMLPYADTAFNRGSFPLKTLEYLSAGLPVVATDLPATRWLGAETESLIIATDAVSFADAVARTASTPPTPELRAACHSFAEAHSYERRAADLLAAIDRRSRASPCANAT